MSSQSVNFFVPFFIWLSFGIITWAFAIAMNARSFLVNRSFQFFIHFGISYIAFMIPVCYLVLSMIYKNNYISFFQWVNLWLMIRLIESLSLVNASLLCYYSTSFNRLKWIILSCAFGILSLIFGMLLSFIIEDLEALRVLGFALNYYFCEFIILVLLIIATLCIFLGRKTIDASIIKIIQWTVISLSFSQALFMIQTGHDIPFYFFGTIAYLCKLIFYYLLYKALITIILYKPHQQLSKEINQRETLYKNREESFLQLNTELETLVMKRMLELKDSETRFNVFMNYMPLLVSIKDCQRNLVYANPMWKNVMNQGNDDIIGKKINEFNQLPEKFIKQIEIDEQTIIDMDKHIIRTRSIPVLDDIRYFYDVTFPIHSNHHDRIEFLGSIAFDITEKIKTEELNRLNESRLNALVHLNEMIDKPIDQIFKFSISCAVELTNSAFGVIGFVDQETDAIQFHVYHENYHFKQQMIIIPLSNNIQNRFWLTFIQNKKMIIWDKTDHSSEKIPFPTSHLPIDRFMAIPFLIDDQVKIITAVANKTCAYEYTDSRQLQLLILGIGNIYERQCHINDLANQKICLEQAIKKAEEANEIKIQFLSHISHELRTPLSSIYGYTQLIIDNDNLTPFQNNAIQIIQNSIDYQLMLLNDILDFSRLNVNHLQLIPDQFYFPSFMSDIVNLQKMKAHSKGLSFDYQKSSIPKFVYFDEGRLRQVLLNLIDNAIKFTQQGKVCLNVYQKDSRTFFEIMDTGIGIQQEKIDEIFKPFIRCNETIKTSGSGLGLTISNELVRLMGGQIQVKSEKGKGSTFYFDIMITEMLDSSKDIYTQNRSIIGYQGDIKKVLIIDDNSTNRIVFKKMLENIGFIVQTAESAQQAFQFLKSYSPDLILIDIHMPKINGFECVKTIRNKLFLQSIKIIAISADSNKNILNQALNEKFDGFIIKPLKIEDIVKTFGKVLGLQWISKEQDNPLHDDPIILPPLDILQSLLKMVQEGNLSELKKCLHQLKTDNPDLMRFSERIISFTHPISMECIKNFIQQSIEQSLNSRFHRI